MVSYTHSLTGGLIQPSTMSYGAYTFKTDLVLVWPSSFSNNPHVTAAIMDLTAEEEGLKVILPDARVVSVGQNILLNNRGEQEIALYGRDSEEAFFVLKPGSSFYIYLTNNTTIPGIWSVIPFGQGAVVVTSVGAESDDPEALGIEGSPVTGAGRFLFKLSNTLRALSVFAKKGFATLTSKGWEGRQIVAGQNITVKDGEGEKGNPVIGTEDNVGFKNAGIEVLEIAKLSSKEVIKEFNIAKEAIHNELMAKNSTTIDKLRSSGHKCLIMGTEGSFFYTEKVVADNETQAWYVFCNNPASDSIALNSLVDIWLRTPFTFSGKKLANKSVPTGALEQGFLMPFARAGVTKELENPGVNHKVKIYTTYNVRAVSLESGVFYVHFTDYTPGNTRYLCSITPYISNRDLYNRGIIKFGIIDKRDYCVGIYCQFWSGEGKFVENCNFDSVVWT